MPKIIEPPIPQEEVHAIADQPEEKKPGFNINDLLSVFIPLLLALAIGVTVGYAIWGRSSTTRSAGAMTLAEFSASDDPARGPQTAPITIVEFSDFQCPYCRSWEQQVWPQLQAAYGSQIRLVYRDFPLTSIHPEAKPAAEAAECANEQGKYWQFHDLLFTGADNLGRDTYLDHAATLGLDIARFTECIDTNRYAAEVEADIQDGLALGVQGTPTFIIGNQRLGGAYPFESFQEIIDASMTIPAN